MGISKLQLNNFKDIFTGNVHNYGQHKYEPTAKGQKERGKSWSVPNKLLKIAQYQSHLDGDTGLGVVFVNEEGNCKFAVIDVDVYDQNFDPYLEAIERHNFPLVPFYSKSGGLHIYIFFEKPVKVKDAIKRASQMARILGITLFSKQHKKEALEIFPKQLRTSENNMGSWINLPYFNAENTRQGLIRNGKMLELDEALTYIVKNKLTTIEKIDSMITDLPYNDAPPCLQTLALLNMLGENSGRNNYLFSFGVYLKKKDENYFEQSVIEINNSMPFPIEVRRIEETLLSSLRKKDYTYKCTASPCIDFCDKKVCAKRKYGIGQDGGYFTNLLFGTFTQFKTHSPYYEWEVKGQDATIFKKLRFKNEDEIIKQDVFLKLCFRELHFLPFKMKQVEWFKLVNQALLEVRIISIDKEDDTSPLVRFNNLFFDFLTARALADTQNEIVLKKVFFNEETRKYVFRTRDLLEYLYDIKNFRSFATGEIHGILRDIGAVKGVVRVAKGAQVRIMSIREEKVDIDYISGKQEYVVDYTDYLEEEQF